MSFTYACLVTLFLALDFTLSALVGTKNENATIPKIDFVEMVKDDLRRNNDDYEDIKYDNKLTSATEGYYGISKKDLITLKVKKTDIVQNYRRTNADSVEYNYYDQEKSTTKKQHVINNATTTTNVNPIKELLRSQNDKKMIKGRLAKKVNKKRIKKPMMLITIKSTTNTTRSLVSNGAKIPNIVNKDTKEKFKKFLAKNKELLKDFLSSKMEVQTQKTMSSNPLLKNDLVNILRPEKLTNTIRKGKKYLRINQMDLPNADILDMAPAKGAPIHRMRIRNRLCQRHVLMPEGPKYNSLGEWYLPAHELVVNRPYQNTFPPKILLPRCCNCCKKSVLGCE